jgi:hypothetical protein
MKLMSALRVPCHSRAASPAGAEPVDQATLDRTMVVTELVVAGLCAARVGTDLQHGPLTLEGDLALALLIIVALALLDAIGHDRARIG